MRYLIVSSAFALLLAVSGTAPVAAQAAPVKPSPPENVAGDQYRDEALVIEEVRTTLKMRADGTGERTIYSSVRMQSEGAAQQFSVLRLTYASATETANLDFVRVRKPDGSVLETPVGDGIEATAEVSREAPLYSDLKETHLPVRSLGRGDTLEYQFHSVIRRAEAPGQFWGAQHFTAKGIVVLKEVLTLSAPANTYVQVWSPHHTAQITDKDGLRTWQWTSAQTRPSTRDKDGKMIAPASEIEDPDEDADGRSLPSVAWTTFHSWADVGAWYRGLAASRAEPTDTIRAKAEELTKTARSPQEQAEALYQFVTTQVRYVGIDLGVGRYQPHAAAEVLANGYGDCKDKDTLLEALLRAKGFTTAPALIGAGIAPVADVPSPAVFNHVITTVTLDGKQVWLDSTPGGEPFQVLIPAIRDQEALMVPLAEPARLVRTPADPPFRYSERFEANANLTSAGLLEGRMTMSVRSDNELGFRLMLQRVSPAQWDEAMQYISSGMGFGGKVSHANFVQGNPPGPVRLTYDYSRPEYADWANRRILPLFPLLEITTIDKEKAPEHDIDQGAPRTLEALTRIKLPENFHADLPEGIHVKRPYATFDQAYRLEGGDLVVDRKVVILQKKVPKGQWKDYLAYTKAIGMDSGESYIQLLPPAETAVKTEAGKPGKKESKQTDQSKPGTAPAEAQQAAPDASAGSAPGTGATALQRIQEAREALMKNDWDTARERLNEARELDPKAPGVMAMLGMVAAKNGSMDEAITDVKAELSNHPDVNDAVVLLLAQMYTQAKRDDDALALLRQYSKRDSVPISRALSSLQYRRDDFAGVVATMAPVVAAHPEDKQAAVFLAQGLLKAGRTDEAVAAAKAAMDGSDEPDVLNDGSYLLAEADTDLALAEKSARHAVELLETASSQRSLQEANSKAFQEAEALAATWDTLGWILFKEKRAADAAPYVEAAWFNQPNVSVGGHLAQICEALGKPAEALAIDRMALATDGASARKQEFAAVTAHAEQLEKAGSRSAQDARSALQEMRSFQVRKETGIKGWGTFRVQLGSEGVLASDLVQGAPAVKPMTTELNKLAIAKAVPPGSHAKLLRDGVLSCSSERPQCEFVLMPKSNLLMERVQ